MSTIGRPLGKLTILLLSLCLCASYIDGDAGSESIHFPSSQRKYRSRDGRYELYNVDYDNKELAHTLFLKDTASGKTVALLSYGRHVTAIWSPVGSRLIVNDYGGSDFSDCLVYSLDKGREPIHLEAELRQNMPSDRDVFENHHVYVEGRQWIDLNRIKVRIWGYGELDRGGGGFTIWLEYKIGNGFKLISKHRTKAK